MEVTLQFPLPLAVPEPIAVAPEYRMTVLNDPAFPLKVGWVTFVILSLAETPLSEAAVMSGVDGALGFVVSIVIVSPEEAVLTLPAASVAVAVMV